MAVCCPMCGSQADLPALEDLLAACAIEGRPAAVLRTVWAGAGREVRTSRIFDAMYADDIDGGPSMATAYRELRAAKAALDGALAGTGVRLAAGRHSTGSLRLTYDAP